MNTESSASAVAFRFLPPGKGADSDFRTVAALKLPTPRFFNDSLLGILGQLLDYRSGVTIKATWENLYLPVLRKSGIDPDTHPQIRAGHWHLQRRAGNKPSLHRKVNLCFRYRKDAPVPLVFQTGNHHWGLTPEGAARALVLRQQEDPNFLPEWQITGRYFAHRGKPFQNSLRKLARDLGYQNQLDFEEFIRSNGFQAMETDPESLQPLDIIKAMCPGLEIPALPSDSFFHTTVVDTIAKKAAYRANIGIRFDRVVDNEVLRCLGIDPDKDSRIISGIWPLRGKDSLHQQIQLALTKQQVVIRVARDVYALSEEGIQQARLRNPPKETPAPVVQKKKQKREREPSKKSSPGDNIVVEWLNQELAKGLLEIMRAELTSTLPKSANLGEIDDLIHNYLAQILGSQSFAERIRAGKLPTPRTLASWARLRAFSKFRDASRDCLGRATREARTSQERLENDTGQLDSSAVHEAVVKISLPSRHTPIHLVHNADGQISPMAGACSGMPLLDVSDPHDSEAEIIAALDMQTGLGRMERAIKKHKPGAPERYWKIFQLHLDDKSCQEIADIETVSRNRAASLLVSMRGAVRDSQTDSDRAAAIMAYVKDSPNATLADLDAEFDYGLKHITKICDWLAESRFLEIDRGRRHPALQLTFRGETVLRERNESDTWSAATHVII